MKISAIDFLIRELGMRDGAVRATAEVGDLVQRTHLGEPFGPVLRVDKQVRALEPYLWLSDGNRAYLHKVRIVVHNDETAFGGL